MKRGYSAALLLAAVTSSAAMAAQKGDPAPGYVQPGTYFNCLIPTPGPKGYRIGGCWLNGAIPN